MEISDLDITSIAETTHRLIPSRFPPIDLYERVASPEEFEILHEIESLTNPRLRDVVGNIHLVAKEDRIAGSGTSFIMAAFTHSKAQGDYGRFDKGYGVYYCARELETAIEETKYHRAKFFLDFNSGPTRIDMRGLVADLKAEVHTIVNKQEGFPAIYHLKSYRAAQELGEKLKNEKSWGLQYNSVRTSGICYAIFRPPALSNCRQSKHYEFYFDGQSITHITQKTEVK